MQHSPPTPRPDLQSQKEETYDHDSGENSKFRKGPWWAPWQCQSLVGQRASILPVGLLQSGETRHSLLP